MKPLPPGQKAIDDFPRFGLPQYTDRFPTKLDTKELRISGDIEPFTLTNPFSDLQCIEQHSDFHCVTTWSKLDLRWGGVRFSDFYRDKILPKTAGKKITHVVQKAQDGYRTSLLMEDLMRDNVILADELNGTALNIAHGAPLRLIAPDHYGYKNPKHLDRIEFYTAEPALKSGMMKAIDHPRARVAHEERANFAPGWILRFLYRIGIKSTITSYQEALDAHLNESHKP